MTFSPFRLGSGRTGNTESVKRRIDVYNTKDYLFLSIYNVRFVTKREKNENKLILGAQG
jgi:hypothetical protein